MVLCKLFLYSVFLLKCTVPGNRGLNIMNLEFYCCISFSLTRFSGEYQTPLTTFDGDSWRLKSMYSRDYPLWDYKLH